MFDRLLGVGRFSLDPSNWLLGFGDQSRRNQSRPIAQAFLASVMRSPSLTTAMSSHRQPQTRHVTGSIVVVDRGIIATGVFASA